MRRIYVRTLLLTALFLVFPLSAGAAKPAGPVVVELFTSQNCSDCPQADALLASIAHNPDNGLIVLGCHVTTWDNARWKDTLSLPECSERQRDYAGILEQNRTYTPNMVVNGTSSFNGARAFDLDLAVRKARQKNEAAHIQIDMTEKGFEVTLPDLPAGQHIPYELNVITYMTNSSVAITAGENSGQEITYAHAVSGITRLAPWQGRKETRLIKMSMLNSDHLHGIVVTAQPVRGGKIRAAGEHRIYFN